MTKKILAVTITTPGGDNPLLMDFITDGPFYRGIPVTLDSNGDSAMKLVGKGGKAPYAFTIIAGGDSHGNLNGLTLDPDGAFHGTPAESGHFAFVAEVQDDNGDVFPHSFAVDFLTQLVVVSEPPRPGEIDVDYSHQFIVEDFTGFVLTTGYSLHSGDTLPNGFSLASNGLLTATPPTEPYGTSVFRVDVTDGTDTITIDVTLIVYESVTGSWKLQIHSLSSHTDQMIDMYDGVFWSNTLLISGGLGPFTVSMGAGWLDGITMGANSTLRARTVLFSGVPHIPEGVAPQVEPVTVLITDALGGIFSYQVLCFQAKPQKPLAIQENGSTMGDLGPEQMDFIGEGGVDVQVASAGVRRIIRIIGHGGGSDSNGDVVGGGGIDTINGVPPDSSGNLEIVSPDASIEFGQDSNGQLTARSLSSGGSGVIRARLAQDFNLLPPYTYNNGSSGIGATITANANGALVIDGVTASLNDVILLLWEFSPSAAVNGLYRYTTVGDGSHAFVLTRDSRMDEPDDFSATLVAVGSDGVMFHDTIWQGVVGTPVVIGTTTISFQQQNYRDTLLMFYRRDDLTAVAGNDEVVLDWPAFSDQSDTLSIFINGVLLATSQYTKLSATVYLLSTPLSGEEVVTVSYWSSLVEPFNPSVLQTSGTGHRYYRLTISGNAGTDPTYTIFIDEISLSFGFSEPTQTLPADAIAGAATATDTALAPAYAAFDSLNFGAGFGAPYFSSAALPQSITYDFGFNNSAIRLDIHCIGIGIVYAHYDHVGAMPTDFIVESSDDGTTWTTELTVTGNDWGSPIGGPGSDETVGFTW